MTEPDRAEATGLRAVRPEAALDVLRAQATRGAEVREQLAALVGEARSDDTFVTAVVDPQGLTDLRLEPKAMRLPSVDLAATIVEVSRRARADLDAKRAALAAELGADVAPSLDESLAQLDRLRSMVAEGHGDLRAVFERFRAATTDGPPTER